jgi:hypothetical protein
MDSNYGENSTCQQLLASYNSGKASSIEMGRALNLSEFGAIGEH